MMNLSLKLQSTAVKTQSKTIDLELRKLEAAQLAEHMTIITVSLKRGRGDVRPVADIVLGLLARSVLRDRSRLNYAVSLFPAYKLESRYPHQHNQRRPWTSGFASVSHIRDAGWGLRAPREVEALLDPQPSLQ